MARFMAGAVAALLLSGAGLFLWTSVARGDDPLPAAPAPSRGLESVRLADPPAASEKSREEKRFSRYDRDRDGMVAREEYLGARRKAFARLDVNGDGRLGFDEYAVKAIGKFAGADADKSGALDATEFAATRVARQAAARCACPPAKDEAD